MKPEQRSRRRAFAAALACAALSLAGAGRASADVVPTTYSGRGAGIPYDTGDFVYKGQEYNGFIGQFVMQASDGSQFGSFCVDLDHGISPGDTANRLQRSTNDGLHDGPQIAYLYNKYDAGGHTIFTHTDDVKAAALQVAIWKLWADGGTSNVDKLNMGNFEFDPGKNPNGSAVASEAVAFIDEAIAHADVGLWLDASLGGTLPDHQQNVMGPTMTPQAGPTVPEPASALLVGLGLVGLAVYRRSRRVV